MFDVKIESDSRNLYLVGFMGVGKSTVGRLVARRLGMHFFDSDSVIEKEVGKSVTEIFEEEGEGYFRELEKGFIERHPKRGCVVACGGGLLIPDGSLEKLQEEGVVVCLYASAETILKRTHHRTTRPLLNVENKEEQIKDLLGEREKIYLNISPSIITDHRPLSEIVKHTLRIYNRESARQFGG